MSRGKARALRILLLLGPPAVLCALELALCALGIGAAPPGVRLRALQDGGHEIEVLAPFSSVRARAVIPPAQDDGSIRMLFLGASTTAGVPYAPLSSYPAMVGVRLEAMVEDLDVELVNLGAPTLPARTARNLARLVVESIGGVDVCVIEAGHNEYLEHNLSGAPRPIVDLLRFLEDRRLYRLAARAFERDEPADVRLAARDRPGLHHADPAPPDAVEGRFERDVTQAIRVLRGAGAEVLLVVPPADWIDYGPEESLVPAASDPGEIGDELMRLESALERVEAGEAGGETEERLLGDYRALLQRAPRLSIAEHRISVLERRRGDPAEARALLERAFDHAVRPHVITPRLQRRLRALAVEEGARVVDAQARFEDASEDGIVSLPWIVDHCHPSLEGQHLLAGAVIEVLRESGAVAPRERWRPEHDLDLNATLIALGVPRDLRFAAETHAGTADLRFALASFSPRRYARRAATRLRAEAGRPGPGGALAGVAMGVALLLAGDDAAGVSALDRALAQGGAASLDLLDRLRMSGARVQAALTAAGR